jgi:hypothetical protein
MFITRSSLPSIFDKYIESPTSTIRRHGNPLWRESWSGGSYNYGQSIYSSNPGFAPNPQVRWGLDNTYGATQDANAANVPIPSTAAGYLAQPSANIDDTLYITTLIEGLSPETTYHYSVSFDGVNWGPDTTFTTGKTGIQNFRWVGMGDMNSYVPSSYSNIVSGDYGTITSANVGNGGSSYYVVQGVGSLGTGGAPVSGPAPDFIVFAGDLSYAGGGVNNAQPGVAQSTYAPQDWDYFLSLVGANVPGAAQSTPWMFGVGNHEMEPLTENGYAGFLTRFNQNYATGSGSPVNQTWVYGNVAFIQLDGNDLSAEITNNNGYTAGAQTTWLTNTLAGYRAAGSNVDFIVCYFHNCMYCTNTTHGSDSGIRTVWEPIFDQYQVDLVVNGHVHAYERTYPIVAGLPTAVVPSGGTVNQGTYPLATYGSNGSGTTYICAGNAGQSSYNSWYGPSGGGDVNAASGSGQPGTVSLTTEPKTNIWSGSNTSTGGTGSSEDIADAPSGQASNYYLNHPYSAYRHANYGFIVVDVTAPTSSNPTTSMHIQAVSPSGVVNQSGGSPANDSAVVDSVTITRNSAIPAAQLPQFANPALIVGGAALAAGGAAYLAAKHHKKNQETPDTPSIA